MKLDDIIIVHPCAAWARSAKRESWAAAVAAMKAGSVLVGVTPGLGHKTTMDFSIFREQVAKEGLHMFMDEMGFAMLGKRENFPASVLAQQERDAEKMRVRFGLN